jgi:hypothetical protein
MNIPYYLGVLAAAFGNWSGSLRGTANNIRGVPILGPYLAGAYDFAASMMADAFSGTVRVQQESIAIVVAIQNFTSQLAALNPLRNWSNQLTNFISNPLATLTGWLQSLVPLFNYLRSDQAGWIRAFIGGVAWHIPQWLSDPGGWVRDRLTAAYGHVSQFLTDPLGWLRARLAALAGHVTQFLNDPTGFVRFYFTNLAPNLTSFLNDPGGWVRDRFLSATGLTMSFFADPFAWLRDKLFFYYPALRDLLTAPAAFVAGKFVDGIETTIETYKARLLRVFEHALSSLF